jgi:P pilus assembly chaperone PapD
MFAWQTRSALAMHHNVPVFYRPSCASARNFDTETATTRWHPVWVRILRLHPETVTKKFSPLEKLEIKTEFGGKLFLLSGGAALN